MEPCHIGKEGGSNRFSSSAVLQMDDMQYLTKPVNYHQQAAVPFWCRDGQEIHGNIMPRDTRHGNRLQEAAMACVFSFCALAGVTGVDVLLYALSHPWEPVLLMESGKGTGNAHVTSVVVVRFQQLVLYRQRYSHLVSLRGDAIE